MIDNHTTTTGKDYCPYCNYKVDSASPTEGDHIPVPGDLSICLCCGNFLYFEEDMRLGKFPDILFHELPEKQKDHLNSMKYAIQKMGFGVKQAKTT